MNFEILHSSALADKRTKYSLHYGHLFLDEKMAYNFPSQKISSDIETKEKTVFQRYEF